MLWVLRTLLPFNIQLSWPLDFFVVTQGPEQGVLFYTGVSIKYQSLFGLILKLWCVNNVAPFGETTPNQKGWGNYDVVQTLGSLWMKYCFFRKTVAALDIMMTNMNIYYTI